MCVRESYPILDRHIEVVESLVCSNELESDADWSFSSWGVTHGGKVEGVVPD